jgi:uncharacterized protein
MAWFDLVTPTLLLVGIPAIVITGISKSGFGGAFGGMAVALLSLVMPPLEAAAVTLPILCLMDWLGLKAFWRRWSTAELRHLLPGALLGIALATATASAVSADTVRVLVGAVALAFVANALAGPARAAPVMDRADSHGQSLPARPALASLAATASGFSSFIAHAGGPPLLAYLLPRRLERQAFIATTVVFFLVTNSVKLLPYFALGQFTPQALGAGLVLAPFAPLGVWLGMRLPGRFSPQAYARICLLLLAAAGLKLLFDGARGLLATP